MRSGPEGQAAGRADGAVVRGGGEADFDEMEKVLEQAGVPGLGVGSSPALQHLSTVYSVGGVFPEGQIEGRADAPSRAVRKFARFGGI